VERHILLRLCRTILLEAVHRPDIPQADSINLAPRSGPHSAQSTNDNLPQRINLDRDPVRIGRRNLGRGRVREQVVDDVARARGTGLGEVGSV
jgi:hypothetical protein